jgi:thiamine biosynthesis lipoprotein
MRHFGTALIALALLPDPGSAREISRARYLMGTVCEVAADGEEKITAAFDEAARIERLLSTWRDDSELSRLNRGDAAPASVELRALLTRVEKWRHSTGGAFEPRIRPLIDAWRTREEGAWPEGATIAAALRAVEAGIAPFEEGGFGKGYAIDRMLQSADFVNFGGQIGVRGSTLVRVADPTRRNHPVLQFTLRDASLSTSAGSEKTFEVGGKVFTHIIDPRTGAALPPRGSVSVVEPGALEADILSTALYVMGPEEGLRWANAHDVAALFITSENQIRVSAPFRDRIRDLRVLDREFSLKE